MIYTQLPPVPENARCLFRPATVPLLINLGAGITFDYLASSGSEKTGNAKEKSRGKPYFIGRESRDCNFCTRV